MTGLEFALVLLAWAVGAASPGPATVTIAAAAMGGGRRNGVLTGAGVLAGSAFWGMAAMLGMSALMLSQAWIVEVLRYLGAAYLMYLALKSLRAALRPAVARTEAAARNRGLPPFWRGLLIHLTNPKPIFGWGAVFAVLVPPGAAMDDLLTVYLSLVAVSLAIFLGYGVLFSAPGVAAGYRRLGRWFELAFAALFGAAALKILTTRIA
ncbi:LysE family transporter [Roseibacterium sp. SDUM158016]|uniref:LysE family translocator n=1 Tax=Roseicyclus sediminis TaxID=2980997 RepID=UPI0021D1F3DD|nr:LysE family transporter [Roseibacterium sp. SDUM158016]MCU4652575.1 LysE family transporter [Roseibacterium sp. SDUM158016]